MYQVRYRDRMSNKPVSKLVETQEEAMEKYNEALANGYDKNDLYVELWVYGKNNRCVKTTQVFPPLF